MNFGELILWVLFIALIAAIFPALYKSAVYSVKITKGLSVDCSSLADLKSKLENNPWTNDQDVRLENDVLSIFTDSTRSSFKLKNNVLTAKTDHAQQGLGRITGAQYFETYCIMQYLQMLCDETSTLENFAAFRSRYAEKNSISATKWRKLSKIDSTVSLILLAITVIVGIVLFITYYSRQNSMENYVGSIVFEGYSTSVTVQEAFDSFYPSGKWNCTVKNVKELKKQGMAYATWTGKCDVTTLAQTYHFPISFTFSASVQGEDQTSIAYEYVEINGSRWYTSDLLNALVYTELMDLAYGNTDQAIVYMDVGIDSIENMAFASVSKYGSASAQNKQAVSEAEQSSEQDDGVDISGIESDFDGPANDDSYVIYDTFDELYAAYGDNIPSDPQTADGHLLYDYSSWPIEDKIRFDSIRSKASYYGADTSESTDYYSDNGVSSNENDDTKYLGSYSMISSDPYMGADLEIYIASEDGKAYLFGTADYRDYSGDVFGELRIIDNRHFRFEDAESGGAMNLSYDPDTSILTVEEEGSFGGLNVTFAGRYAQTGGAMIP